MDAIVLAGGLGTRLRPVVSEVPKPMAPINGRPFLELLLEYWIGQGVRRFVLSVGYLADRVTRHFGSHWCGAEIVYATEPEALGTGGALLFAADKIQTSEVLVMNGDTYFAVSLQELRAFHGERQSDWTLALFRSSESKRYQGIGLEADGRVSVLAGELANGGVYMMNAAKLEGLPWHPGGRFSLESELMPYSLRNGWRVYGRAFDRPFVDIGVPEDYQNAGSIIQ